jgi:hypothetical protein
VQLLEKREIRYKKRLLTMDVMFVRMIDVLGGCSLIPPDESGGYRMIDVIYVIMYDYA